MSGVAAPTLSLSEAADRYDVPIRVLRRWAARHRVTPVGRVYGRGRGGEVALYRADELEPLIDQWRNDPRRVVDPKR